MKQFEYCICIGRYQPFHDGTKALVLEALNVAENAIIVIGSANKAPSIQNPWSATQRESFIKDSLTNEQKARIKFVHVKDYYYLNNKWLTEVQQLISDATNRIDDDKICNIGNVNDFPQWKFIKFKNIGKVS